MGAAYCIFCGSSSTWADSMVSARAANMRVMKRHTVRNILLSPATRRRTSLDPHHGVDGLRRRCTRHEITTASARRLTVARWHAGHAICPVHQLAALDTPLVYSIRYGESLPTSTLS